MLLDIPRASPMEHQQADIYPLSVGQQALWFLNQAALESKAYNIASAARMRGDVDLPSLRWALRETFARHAALRSCFFMRDGHPRQQVRSEVSIDIREVDASNWSSEELGRHILNEAQRPFDLEQDLLCRVAICHPSQTGPVLLLSAHHIAFDGWSLWLCLDEINTLYKVRTTGCKPSLPAPRGEYAEFVSRQKELLSGPEAKSLRAYWCDQLSGDLPVLSLPADRIRPRLQSRDGTGLGFGLDSDITRRLKDLAKREKSTLYTVLLAAFQVLLHRYSQQDIVLVGSPVAGRTMPAFRRTVGYFVNTLVMRGDLSANPTFRDFLAQMDRTVRSALRHQDYPFASLVKDLGVNRDPGRSPVYQASFVFQKPGNLARFADLLDVDAPGPVLEGVGLNLGPLSIAQGEDHCDLSLQMSEAHETLVGLLQYRPDLFEAATIRRALGHYRNLLEALLADPEQPIEQVPVLGAEERSVLLNEWNATARDYPRDTCFPQLLEACCRRRADATAAVFRDERISYAELNARANQVARRLRELGAVPGRLVGIYMERSLDMLVALLGVLKSGAAYLPLDPGFPAERLAFMLADAQAAILVTEKALLRQVPPSRAHHLVIDEDPGGIGAQDEGDLEPAARPQDLAYVIYTSGSTGTPKGVQIPHRALVNFLESMRREPGFGEEDVLLAVTTLSFDIAAQEFLLPLLAGGCVAIADSDRTYDGFRLMHEIEGSGATMMLATPSKWRMLIDCGWGGAPGLKILCGGEALTRDLADELLERCDTLWNMYGPTEATVCSTFCKVERVEQLSIGRPIANTRIYVLDDRLEPVPIGVPGELHIGGDGLAVGYLNRPELTTEKFVPNPFSDDPEARLYKSGDLARWRADGTIECLGRTDDQVKIRGFRIELGEIESVLRQHEAVRDAAVAVREDSTHNRQLAAYFTVIDGAPTPGGRELQAFLARSLPAYMVPALLTRLDVLPLTASGKVDRQALADSAGVAIPLEEGVDAVAKRLRTPTEELVSQLWSEVLGAQVTGRDDNFFELGGHSLMATQVVSRLTSVLGVEIPLRVIFEASTVAALAAWIDAARKSETLQAAPPPLERIPRDGALPLSFSQERMWFLHQLEPESAAYNMGSSFRLAGQLDREKARQSLQTIIARHENLRTTFYVRDGEPFMRIADQGELDLGIHDLRALPAKDREQEARKRAAEEIRRPFDLAAGPLLRVRLYQLGNEDQLILFCMHHIISDLWSTGVLSEELGLLYCAESDDIAELLPEPQFQYADFASWQRRWLQGEVLESQLTYWKARLAGVPVLELPLDRPRPATRGHEGSLESLELPAGLIERLKAFSVHEGVTPYMTLLAVFKVLLMRYSAQKDLVVGSPIANRTRVEVEQMTGTFVNTLALRTDLSGNPPFRELLERVRDTTLSAYAHQDLPFEKLVEELRPQRETSQSPLVQVLFNLANAPFELVPRIGNLAWSPVEIDRGAAQFDLSLFVDLEISAKAFIEYNTDLFEAGTIRRALGHYRNLLEALLADPEQPIEQVPVLGAEERSVLLNEWNATARDYPRDTCFPQLLEACCRRRADATAAVFGDERISYAELNARANQVARRLRELGAVPGRLVGIYMERSLDMLVALLGVLKSGAAYLPLDPGFPAERLAFMLADAQAAILVTEKALLGQVPPSRAHHLVIDEDPGGIGAQDEGDLEPAARPQDLAYVIYTSGSTGTPKGVQIPHRALVNFLESMRREPGFGEEDVLLAVTTLSFDIAALELLLPLLAGGCVLLVDRETSYDGFRLSEEIGTRGATIMQATPATWRMLIDCGWDGAPGLKILCGGEALTRDLADELLERCHGMWNMYGPTETTIWSAIAKVGREEAISIGRPIANTRIYLLDEHLAPVPIGVPGELHIGGEGLAVGYLNRPELTTEKFVPNPFSDDPEARLYKSGDLARWRAEGMIECLGRMDNQVKIRGFRIELGEIEAVLSTHPEVSKNLVVARADASGQQRLIAYIVPAAGTRPTLAELRPHLRHSLPDYMIPAVVMALEELPVTPNGKIDRNALPDPDQAAMDHERPLVEPRTPIERKLVRIWCEILNVDAVSVHDDFFDLGGHSLLAARLAERLRRVFDIDLPLRSIFEDSTVAAMARRLTFDGRDGAYRYNVVSTKTGSLIPIRTDGTRKPFLLVSGTYTGEDPFLGYMANLIPHLDPEVPVFGFRARGLDGLEKPHASAEQMATDYVAELLAMQPEGPYYLGGECVGGVVAYEMAQQLLARNKHVALLVLLDTVRPSLLTTSWFHLYHLGRRIRSISRHLFNIFSSDNFKDLVGYLAVLLRRKRRRLLPRGEEERSRNRVERIEQAYARLMFRYRPKEYLGKLTLIVNEEQYARNRYLGWRGLALRGVEAHSVPGNHLTRITDFVDVTGERLRDCIYQAQIGSLPFRDTAVGDEEPR